MSIFIVSQNELHNVINCHMIKMNSKSSNQTCCTILIIDTYPKNSIYHNIQYTIMQTMTTNKTKNLAPFIKIYKRTKIIFIDNLYLKIGIVNGTIGYVKTISFSKSHWMEHNN